MKFDKDTMEFVHPDGGRQKVYSNLVQYYAGETRWSWNYYQLIDPELKQEALEHCLGFSLGPRPVSLGSVSQGALPVHDCKQIA